MVPSRSQGPKRLWPTEKPLFFSNQKCNSQRAKQVDSWVVSQIPKLTLNTYERRIQLNGVVVLTGMRSCYLTLNVPEEQSHSEFDRDNVKQVCARLIHQKIFGNVMHRYLYVSLFQQESSFSRRYFITYFPTKWFFILSFDKWHPHSSFFLVTTNYLEIRAWNEGKWMYSKHLQKSE